MLLASAPPVGQGHSMDKSFVGFVVSVGFVSDNCSVK